MNIRFNFNPKTLPRTIAGGISAGLLAAAFTILIILGFNLSTQLVAPISITLTILFVIIFSFKPTVIYVIVALLMMSIGAFLIFLSGREDIAKQITWNPSLLGAGASIGGLGMTFLSTMFPQRPQNTTYREPATPKQTTPEPTAITKYEFALAAILGIAMVVKDILEKKSSKKTK